MVKRVVSIEAGVWWTKVALADYRKKNPPVHKAFAFRTPEHAVEDGYIRDKEAFASALKAELSRHDIHEKEVVFTLSSSKVVTREVMIPFVKDNKIMGIIEAQIRDYFPMDVSNYTISYSKMDVEEEDGKKMLKLLLVAIPDNLLNNYVTFAELAGLKVETFDYIGNGTVQLLCDSFLENAVVVQLEEQATVISILENKKLVFQRVTPYGYGATITAAVEYYQNQVKQEFVGNVYLVGDGSRFAGMHKLFAQELPLPLQEIDFTKVIDLRSGKNKAAEGMVTPDVASSGTRPKAATAVGFLSVIGAAVHPIDARPKDMLVADSKKNDLHTAYVILAGAVLVSVLLILGSGVRQLLAYREHRSLTKRINDLSYVQETYDDYARVQAEEQVYEKLDLATITKNEQLYPLIMQLENELPTTIHVKSIQTDGSLITLNMEADRKVTVGQMLLNFADVTLLENPSIPSMSEESDEDSGTVTWTYTLNAYYTGAFLGEDGHLIKEAVPSADTDADTDTDSVEGEEQTNE